MDKEDRSPQSLKYLKGAGKLIGSTGFGHLLSFLSMPLVARLYGQLELAQWSLFTSFLTFTAIAGSLNYEPAILLPQAEDESEALTLLSLLMGCLSAGIAVVYLGILITWNFLGFGILPLWTLGIGFLGLLSTNLFSPLRYWCIRRTAYGLIGTSFVLRGTVLSIASIIFGAAHIGYLGLISSEVLGRLVGTLSMGWKYLPGRRTPLKAAWNQPFPALIKKYRRFPFLSLPSTLLDNLGPIIMIPVVASIFGPLKAGLFSLVFRVVLLPFGVIASGCADVFHGQFSSLTRGGSEGARALFFRTAITLALIGVIPAGIIAVFGEQIFGTLFGSQWSDAGILAQLVAPWALLGLVVSPLSRVVFVLNGQASKLSYDVFGLLSIVVALWGGRWAGISFVECVAILSATRVISYVVFLLVIISLLSRIQPKTTEPA